MKYFRIVKREIKKSKNTKNKNLPIIAYDEFMTLHKGPSSHPERPSRLKAIIKALSDFESSRCQNLNSRQISLSEASTVHDENYVGSVFSLPTIDSVLTGSCHSPAVFYESSDMFWNKFTSKCASISAGTVMKAAEKVVLGEAPAAFVFVRPPGHHAGAKKAEGFCWLNNVAIAAKRISNAFNRRVCIVDWDVHHGNGTQDIFYESDQILYISIHRYGIGFYPGTGRASEIGQGAGKGFNVNIPWTQFNMGDTEYILAFKTVVLPIIADFAPGLLLVSAGFDAATGDQLGGMDVSPAAYGWMTKALLGVMRGRNCVFALEGGYCLQAISQSAVACVDVLSHVEDEFCDILPSEANSEFDKTNYYIEKNYKFYENDKNLFYSCKLGALDTLKKVLQHQIPFWPILTTELIKINKILKERMELNFKNKEKRSSTIILSYSPKINSEIDKNVDNKNVENVENVKRFTNSINAENFKEENGENSKDENGEKNVDSESGDGWFNYFKGLGAFSNFMQQNDEE